MSDLVERLRAYALDSESDVLINEAVDEIEKLRRCLASRDDFLVQRELFEEYTSTLTVG